MARKAGRGDTGFRYNPESPSAARLAELMDRANVGVYSLAKALPTERKSIQRWLDGGTIILENRRKLGDYFGVPPDEFAPADKLAAIRPLLVELEKIRRQEGLAVGTIVGEVRRLAL